MIRISKLFMIAGLWINAPLASAQTPPELKSNRIVWSLKMTGRAVETVTLARLDANFGPAFTLTYAIGDEVVARQVIGDKAAQDQTRELQIILPPSRRASLAQPLGTCRTTLEFHLDAPALSGTATPTPHKPEMLCLDELRRPYDERFSKWWLRNRGLLGR